MFPASSAFLPISMSARIQRIHALMQKIVVCAVRTDDKVFFPVVEFVSVGVMNHGASRQGAAVHLLDDPHMIEFADSADLLPSIPEGDVTSAVGSFLRHDQNGIEVSSSNSACAAGAGTGAAAAFFGARRRSPPTTRP